MDKKHDSNIHIELLGLQWRVGYLRYDVYLPQGSRRQQLERSAPKLQQSCKS